ncbi:hypothetical protein FHS86_000902 [Roseimarinus sediminis]
MSFIRKVQQQKRTSSFHLLCGQLLLLNFDICQRARSKGYLMRSNHKKEKDDLRHPLNPNQT